MTQENKKIVGQFMNQVVNNGNWGAIEQLVAQDYVYHGPNGKEIKGREGLKSYFKSLRDGFPDMKVYPKQVIAEGDIATVRFLLTGTHTGEFSGIGATGKKIEVPAMVMTCIKNGKITEDWEVYDNALIMEQLGLL